jgi:5-methylcytosine-specific restriction endonuclease McrA
MASWRQDKRSAAERGYGSKWQKARFHYLSAHPLCKLCNDIGQIAESTVVDHIKPHGGDWSLFWDSQNWQPLCKACHDSVKKRQESRGELIGCDVNGNPLDPLSPWHGGVGEGKK